MKIRSLALLIILCWSSFVHAQVTNPAIARATAAMMAAAPRAQADPARPLFHVASPAQWMNDPNGPIYYKGYYHLFYQLTPFSDQSGIKYWGHVRSRDLVKWEPLPIALWPSTELGEESIWSGCCTINGNGQPMAFYTSIGQGKSAFDQAVQWAAIGDDNLLTWQKSLANPVLPESINDGVKIYDWRDPFIFRDGKRTFLVTGGHLARNGDAVVNLYEALNPGLTQWKYHGPLFHVPGAPTAECPNFFKLGNKWVLFVSPYGRVQYFVGDFDEANYHFYPQTNGFLDYGSSFYAPNTMQVPDGHRLVWGWLNGFPGGHGWNGCLSLPRQLSLSSDGQLKQVPAPQLTKLRGKVLKYTNLLLDNSTNIVHIAGMYLPTLNNDVALGIGYAGMLEMQAEIEIPTAKNFSMQFSDSTNSAPLTIRYTGTELQVMDDRAPLQLNPHQRKLNLRIFVDHSVLEVFANDTVCITKIISPRTINCLTLHSDGGSATAKSIKIWPMKTIW